MRSGWWRVQEQGHVPRKLIAEEELESVASAGAVAVEIPKYLTSVKNCLRIRS